MAFFNVISGVNTHFTNRLFNKAGVTSPIDYAKADDVLGGIDVSPQYGAGSAGSASDSIEVGPANTEDEILEALEEAADENEEEVLEVETFEDNVVEENDTNVKIQNSIANLYGKSLEELISEAGDLINSSTLATKGLKEFNESTGKNYSGKYASEATIDFAKEILGEEKLAELGIEKGQSLYKNPNIQKASENNTPKVGDIVFMGEDGDPYHNGVVVAITDDGKYIVQEANSAKAKDSNGKGAALVAYTLNPADGHSKHIQSFISTNAVDETEGLTEDNPDTAVEDSTPQTVESQETDNISQKAENLVNNLYGDDISALLASSGATNANPLVSSINGAKAFSDKMSEVLGKDTNYKTKYSSKATYDVAEALWGKDYLEQKGIKEGEALCSNKNAVSAKENTPKVGDIVLMGEDGDPYHNGVVVAITDDGKYVVQEGSSARAKDGKSQGGALVIYDVEPKDGRTKYIQKVIPLNEDEAETPAPVATNAVTGDDVAEYVPNNNETAEAAADIDVIPNDVEAPEAADIDVGPNNFEFFIPVADSDVVPNSPDNGETEFLYPQNVWQNIITFDDTHTKVIENNEDTGCTLKDREGTYKITPNGTIQFTDFEGNEFSYTLTNYNEENAKDLLNKLEDESVSSTVIETIMTIIGFENLV